MKPILPYTEQVIPKELLNRYFVKSGTYGYLPLIARDGNTHLFYWCEHWERLVPVGATLRDFDNPKITFKVIDHVKDPSADDDCIVVCEGTSSDEDLEVMPTHLTHINDDGNWNFSSRNYSIVTGMSLNNSTLVWAGGYSHFIAKTGKTKILQALVESGDSGKAILGITKNGHLVCIGSNDAFINGDQTNLRWSNCYFSIKYAKTLGYKGFKMIDEPLIEWDDSLSTMLVDDVVNTYSNFSGSQPVVDPNLPTTGSIDQETTSSVSGGSFFEYSNIRWTITKRKQSNSNSIQASEFELLIDDIVFPLTNCNITSIDGRSPSAEKPVKLIDGNIDTKWLDFNFGNLGDQYGKSCIVITSQNSSKLKFNGYNWKTANDAIGRDPISWKIEGSNDGTNWTIIDDVVDYNVTDLRKTSVGPWKLISTAPTPEPDPVVPTTLEDRVSLLEEQVKNLQKFLEV